jgi:hypothetical protein
MARLPRTAQARRRPAAAELQPNHIYNVVLHAESVVDLVSVMTHPSVDLGCRHPMLRYDRSGVHLSALMRGSIVQSLTRDAGRWTVEVINDQTVAGEEAVRFVGKGDRFRKGRVLPEGVGRLVE